MAFLVSHMAAGVWADAPRIINYQGKLTDQNGNPLSGGYNMVFSFYDAPSGGNILGGSWTYSPTGVPVSNGVFNVYIGSNTAYSSDAGNIPLTVFTAGTNAYLEVVVGGETLTPRERLLAAPFALGLAADSVGTDEIVDSTITLSDLNLTSIDSRYLTVNPANFTASTATLAYSVFMATVSGSVGIGTLNPLSPLHITNGTSAKINLEKTGTSANVSTIYNDGNLNITSGNSNLWLRGADNIIMNPTTGNVGIGTTSPATKLHISSGSLAIDGTSPGFSVGGTGFVVTGGNVGVGTMSFSPGSKFEVTGGTATFHGKIALDYAGNSTTLFQLAVSSQAAVTVGGNQGPAGYYAVYAPGP